MVSAGRRDEVHASENAGDLASMGLLLPVSMAAGVALGYVGYKAVQFCTEMTVKPRKLRPL